MQALKKHAQKLPQKSDKCSSLLTAGSENPYPKSTQNDRNRVKVGSWDPRGEARGTVWAQSGKKSKKEGMSLKNSLLFETLFVLFAKKWASFFCVFLHTLQNGSLRDIGAQKALKRRPKVTFCAYYWGVVNYQKTCSRLHGSSI